MFDFTWSPMNFWSLLLWNNPHMHHMPYCCRSLTRTMRNGVDHRIKVPGFVDDMSSRFDVILYKGSKSKAAWAHWYKLHLFSPYFHWRKNTYLCWMSTRLGQPNMTCLWAILVWRCAAYPDHCQGLCACWISLFTGLWMCWVGRCLSIMLQRVNHDHQTASKTNELKGIRLSNIYMQSFGDCNQLFLLPKL